jgi:hypothetical protein
MTRARSATAIIWKTVVSAGAMLATPGCLFGGGGGGGTRTVCEPAAPLPAIEPVATGEPVPAGTGPVTIVVQSQPPGANVLVDDVLQGTTPVSIELPSAETEVRIRITRDGYADESSTVVPDRDQQVEVTMTDAETAARPRCREEGVRGRGFVLA